MVVMPNLRPALKNNNTKFKARFFNDYCDGDCVFYILPIDSKIDFQFIDDEVRAS